VLDLTGAEDGAQKPATPDAMVATPAKARTALLELISQRRWCLRTPFSLINDQTKFENCQGCASIQQKEGRDPSTAAHMHWGRSVQDYMHESGTVQSTG
jgi:hypothetical protein